MRSRCPHAVPVQLERTTPRGQASVEFVATFPVVTLAIVAIVQGFLLGLTLMFATVVVDAAARMPATEPSSTALRRVPVPGPWRRGLRLRRDGNRARVAVVAPRVLPVPRRMLVVEASRLLDADGVAS